MFIYKLGVLLTKCSFKIQNGTLGLQTGLSRFNFPVLTILNCKTNFHSKSYKTTDFKLK